MKIKQAMIVTAVCAIILVALYVLSLERPLRPEQVAGAVEAFGEMETALFADPIDYQKVDALYRQGIARILYEVDQTEDRNLHFNVEDSIARAIEGKIPRIAVHVVEKPIQHGFYRYLIIELKRLAGEKESRADLLAKIRSCYRVLAPVIDKADQWAGAGGNLAARGSVLLAQSEKENLTPAETERIAQEMETLYKGATLLLMLAALDRIEAWQHADKMEALIHMADAKMHYTILYEAHALQYRQESVMVLGEFNKLPKNVDTSMIRGHLKQAFTDLIPELPATRFDPKPAARDQEQENEAENQA